MSNPGGDSGQLEREAFAVLERAVGRMLDGLAHMRKRVEAAEARSAELDELVRRFTGNQVETDGLLARLKQLEDDNMDLRGRLDEGRAGIDRLLAKIRFLENQQ